MQRLALYLQDAHPIREIEIWRAMARVYRQFTEQKQGREHNEDVWRVLLAASTCGPDADAVFATASTRMLSRSEVSAIIAAFEHALAGR